MPPRHMRRCKVKVYRRLRRKHKSARAAWTSIKKTTDRKASSVIASHTRTYYVFRAKK